MTPPQDSDLYNLLTSSNRRIIKRKLTIKERQELEAEVEGCIDLVWKAASQYGISARRFLWLCSTNARSA